MAYQTLNIVGSLTSGVASQQNDYQAVRDRLDALRAQTRAAAVRRNRPSDDDVDAVTDRMRIGDTPEQRRVPFVGRRERRRSTSRGLDMMI